MAIRSRRRAYDSADNVTKAFTLSRIVGVPTGAFSTGHASWESCAIRYPGSFGELSRKKAIQA
jgi:hypothetical protein